MNKIRVSALILCGLICFIFSVSAHFIITNTTHDCSGESCAVCMEIHSCEAVIRQICNGLSGILPIVAIATAYAVFIKLLYRLSNKTDTLISLKVKLSE